jgi:hypothetical protein
MTEYSDRVLEETPGRVTQFLSGLGAVPEIYTTLHVQAGMQHEDVVEGRDMLIECIGLPVAQTAERDTADARAQRAATAELDAYDEPAFARAEATLSRHYPSAATYVFHDLSASQGPAAVKGIATFLARLDALQAGSDPARSGSKAEDKKAIQLLAKRGFTKEERERLAALVQVALGPTTPLDVPDTSAATTSRREKLTKLKAWYDEWATSAHAVVKKRSHLIRLGLAERRSPKSEPDAPPAKG